MTQPLPIPAARTAPSPARAPAPTPTPTPTGPRARTTARGLRGRRLLGAALAWAAAALASPVWSQGAQPASPAAAAATAWPQRPLKLIVPFPPGGAADAVGRLYAERLAEALKQPVLVDNKPGAGATLGGDLAARAAPDGYTLSLAPAGQLTIAPHLQKVGYHPLKDFQPVTLLAQVSYVLAANPALGVHDLAGLIQLAKARPGALTYSSCGNGTLCNLSAELLKLQAGIDLLHVPYKGSAPAVQALLSGEVNLASDTLTVLAPQVRAGKARGLVVTSAERSPLLPEVPTAAEAGLPQLTVSSWFGLALPAGTPAPIVARLSAELAAISRQPELRQKLAQQGLETLNTSPERFAELIRADHQRWGQIIQRAGIRPD